MQNVQENTELLFFEKEILSTGDVAAACRMAKHTIIAAIEKGELRASRTPGGHNRILRDDALLFMEQHNLLQAAIPSILIIESDDFVGEILRQVVGSSQARFHAAKVCYQAGMLMERTKPDIVVVDLAFPGLTFDTMLQHLRDPEFGFACKMVLIGSADEQDAIRENFSGDEEKRSVFLEKPFSVIQLKETVRALLAQS